LVRVAWNSAMSEKFPNVAAGGMKGTLPVKGYGAVMARYIRELQAEGHKPLLARFQMRIYIYATGVTPIGAGKPPGA